MTGKYYSKGTALLINNHVKLFDTNIKISVFQDNDKVSIRGKDIIINNNRLYTKSCLQVNKGYIKQKSIECLNNYNGLVSDFVDNTLLYAYKDKENILNFTDYPDINTEIKGKIAVVVARSTESEEALLSLIKIIDKKRTILIGVDGGADIILSCGMTPDILIGDMDSVSDLGLYKSKDVILHAYIDGRCPCLSRIAPLNIKYKILAMTGTSEDVALLMAYDKGASNIILIGGHNSINDFQERGRQGMGSTLITYLKIQDKLIDYKSIIRLQAIKDNNDDSNYSITEGSLYG